MKDIKKSQEPIESQTDSYFRTSDCKYLYTKKTKLENQATKSKSNDPKVRDITTRDNYPWLAHDDPHRFQTDVEVLYEKIDLKDSALTSKEKAKLMKMILRYRQAFSLRDEIGKCPNLKVDIKVIDESPFFC